MRFVPFIYIALLVLLGATGIGGYFLLQQQLARQAEEEKVDELGELYVEESGNDFLLGDALLQKERSSFPLARPFFEKALTTAKTVEEEAHIKYKIALTYTYEDPAKSIRLMKELAAQQAYPGIQKAYALQHAYRIYANLVIDPELLPVLFEGEPYQGFYVATNTALSLKNYHEYTTLFARVPISDTSIALWYAQEIKENPDLTPEVRSVYLSRVKERIKYADEYVAANADHRNNHALLPRTLINKATAYGLLAEAGVEEYASLYGDAFIEAIKMSDRENQDRSAPRHRYAYYALALNDTREWERARPYFDEIINNIDAHSGMRNAYVLYKDNAFNKKAEAVFMAEQYPPFKALLLTLGWTEDDFK